MFGISGGIGITVWSGFGITGIIGSACENDQVLRTGVVFGSGITRDLVVVVVVNVHDLALTWR